MAIPYVPTTHSDGQSWTAAKANLLEIAARDAHLMPAVRVTRAAAQTGIVTATITALSFDTERFDQAGGVADTMHDNSTNPSRLTCRYAGVYYISGQAGWSANPVTGSIHVRLNGTTFIAQNIVVADYREMSIATLWSLAVNDYVELMVQQQSGSNKDVTKGGSNTPEFMMVRVA